MKSGFWPLASVPVVGPVKDCERMHGKLSDAESSSIKKIKSPQCREGGVLSINQKLIGWLSRSGGKWL